MKTWQSFILGLLVGLIFSASGFLLLQNIRAVPVGVAESTATIQGSQIEKVNGQLLNINTASLKELDALPGIGQEKAQNILDFRTKFGNFHSKEDLLYVPGIGKSVFEQIKDHIFVE